MRTRLHVRMHAHTRINAHTLTRAHTHTLTRVHVTHAHLQLGGFADLLQHPQHHAARLRELHQLLRPPQHRRGASQSSHTPTLHLCSQGARHFSLVYDQSAQRPGWQLTLNFLILCVSIPGTPSRRPFCQEGPPWANAHMRFRRLSPHFNKPATHHICTWWQR